MRLPPAHAAAASSSTPSSQRRACADPDPESGQANAQLQELYRRHSAGLIRRLTRQTGCRETALELAQETFLRLLRMSPGRLAGLERPDAYLGRISANLAHDRGRNLALAERSRDSLEMLSDRVVDQVSLLESRDTLRRLELAIGKLKPRTREIFLAHRLEGLTYAEIAERTGLSVKGVEKQMSKAIAKIDRLLDRA
jgi:RNA polymerase sigma-70 factor (ECF subfamily)